MIQKYCEYYVSSSPLIMKLFLKVARQKKLPIKKLASMPSLSIYREFQLVINTRLSPIAMTIPIWYLPEPGYFHFSQFIIKYPNYTPIRPTNRFIPYIEGRSLCIAAVREPIVPVSKKSIKVLFQPIIASTYCP